MVVGAGGAVVVVFVIVVVVIVVVIGGGGGAIVIRPIQRRPAAASACHGAWERQLPVEPRDQVRACVAVYAWVRIVLVKCAESSALCVWVYVSCLLRYEC